MRAEFDADGRLVATLDANGNRTQIQNNLSARTTTVFDRQGNPTQYIYDQRGNIVAKTDPPDLAAITPLSVIDNSATTLYPGGILNTGFALPWTQERDQDALLDRMAGELTPPRTPTSSS